MCRKCRLLRLQGKPLKGGESRNQVVLPILKENTFRRCYMSVTQLFSGESSFYNMFWNFAFSVVFQKQLVFRFASQQEHFLLCCYGRNPKPFHLLFLYQHSHIAFLLPLRRVDMSDFPQTGWAKLQRLSTKEDEQQPLSVHIWAKKCWNSRNRITNHGTRQW